MMSGWKGLFAIEKDKHAFATLEHNLINGSVGYKYEWPDWLPKKNYRINTFRKTHRKQLEQMKGKVDLVVGGPPCQGFSTAGRRKKEDPRNLMFRSYVEVIKVLRPPMLLLENVRGIDMAFEKSSSNGGTDSAATRQRSTFASRIQKALGKLDYRVFVGVINAMEFGVPQTRKRYFVFGFDEKQLCRINPALLGDLAPFPLLKSLRLDFLRGKKLPTDKPITVREALSDLCTTNRTLVECPETSGFSQISYTKPRTQYQKLLHGEMNGSTPNSMRLVNHRRGTQKRFRNILRTCRRGVLLCESDRKRLKMKKHATIPLDGNKPSHTLTTLPDDLLHYLEPRILTVRESARLQSFPDAFEFKGKYTTGGKQRVRECPRYTQVGNAVPPLLAEIIGVVLATIMRKIVVERLKVKSRKSQRFPPRIRRNG